MRPEGRTFLYDIQTAIQLLQSFVGDKELRAYEVDALLRSAVERQLTIIGEAVSQIARLDRETAGRLSQYQQIIAFRNFLVHAYADVDDRMAWELIQTRLAPLSSRLMLS
jgi:uncharacterized protein with HEPN domain